MNRATLLLALAAVAVIGIAGLLPALGGENRPPAGDGPAPGATVPPETEPTTITLACTGGSSSPQYAELGGVLLASDGAPVPNRPVELYWRDSAGPAGTPSWKAWYANPMARTLADGSFSLKIRPRDPDGSTSAYRVRFPGDPWFAPSESEGVTVVSPAR